MAIDRSARTEVAGLKELRRAIRQMDDRKLTRSFAAMNHGIADHVARRARLRASLVGRQQRAAAKNLRPKRTASAARIELFASDGVPFALGAEFGAAQNKERNIPARTRQMREAQYGTRLVDSVHYGKQVRRRVRLDDKVTELATKARTIKGWNQFPAWTGNAYTTHGKGGLFLFPTIRAEREDIVGRYMESVEKFVAKHIPDGPTMRR